MEITRSARKHGISDADMLHTVRHHILRWPQQEGIWMHIGTDRTGRVWLEVAVVSDARGDRIIHAMPARARFLP